MSYQRLCSLAELPSPGTARQLALGSLPVAVCNVGAQVHAFDGKCPHRGGPLGQGTLEGTQLTCPWHAWTFDATTGECVTTPGVWQTKYAVEVEGDSLLVDVA